MIKPQITIRLEPSLLSELNQYVESTGSSKTEVVVSAIAQYLGCVDQASINQRITQVERRLSLLEAQSKLEMK